MKANSARWKATFEAAQDTPNVDEVRRELNRLLESQTFRDSLRLTSFLKFVVEAALEGKSDKIKSYTIAIEALGRGSAFDPQTDPIVRVEAGRLRQALARYYETAGYSDPVVIDVPRGTYVPNFSWRDIASAPKPSTNSALTTAGITSSAPGGNFANQAQKLNDTLRTFYTLATMHRLQIAAVNREIANARRTLQSSHALLKLATTGPASEIVGTEARRHADVPGHAGASNRRTRKHPTIGTPRRGTGTRPTGAGEG